MDKRLFRIGLLLFSGLIAWVLFRQRRLAPTILPPTDYFVPEPISPDSLVEDAIEAPPHFREADPVELAFVAGALGIDQAAQAAEADVQPAATTALTEAPPQAGQAELVGYCMRCHTKRTIRAAQIEATNDGRRIARGTCAVCGANIVRFVKEAA